MENDILDSLEDLGYTGPLSDSSQFQAAVSSSACTRDFTLLIEWAANELSKVASLDEKVTAISSPDDHEVFLMELSGFLRECNCPYSCLTEGPIDQRLASKSNKLQLVNYLLTELEAARITATYSTLTNDVRNLDLAPVSNLNGAADVLKQTLISLGIPKPPEDITPTLLFEKCHDKIAELLSTVPEHHMGAPLLSASLSDEQWKTVEFVACALKQDYEYRRKMLLQRLGVTIESFTWSDRLKHKEDQMAVAYHPIRQRMSASIQTDVAHLLAARDDLLHIETTSSGAARQRTACDINRVVMGDVPDRGGRAYEHGPPPPEMPSFKQRHPGSGGGPRGGGGGQRRGGGGWGRGGGKGGDKEFWQSSKRGRYH